MLTGGMKGRLTLGCAEDFVVARWVAYCLSTGKCQWGLYCVLGLERWFVSDSYG